MIEIICPVAILLLMVNEYLDAVAKFGYEKIFTQQSAYFIGR